MGMLHGVYFLVCLVLLASRHKLSEMNNFPKKSIFSLRGNWEAPNLDHFDPFSVERAVLLDVKRILCLPNNTEALAIHHCHTYASASFTRLFLR